MNKVGDESMTLVSFSLALFKKKKIVAFLLKIVQIQILYTIFCVPLYISQITICYVFIYFFILNFDYIIRKIKQIYDKL